MTPLQSWSFIILLLALIVLGLWLARAATDAFRARHEPGEDETTIPAPGGRHLYVVSSRQDTADEEDPLAIWKDVLN